MSEEKGVNLFTTPPRACFLPKPEGWDCNEEIIFREDMLHAMRSARKGYPTYITELLNQLAVSLGVPPTKGYMRKLIGKTIRAWQLDIFREIKFRVTRGSPHWMVMEELTRRVTSNYSYDDIKGQAQDFYQSKEWRTLRAEVLVVYGTKCMWCGRNPRDHGVVIHVDHINPITYNPALALYFSNLQVLCEDCNIGKSNVHKLDRRPLPLNNQVGEAHAK